MYHPKPHEISAVSEFPLDVNRTDFNWPICATETLLIFAEADNELNNGPSSQACKW